MTPGRNEACTCGSGRKYKRCCGAGGARLANGGVIATGGVAGGAGGTAAAPTGVAGVAPSAVSGSAMMNRLSVLAGAGRYAELEAAATPLLERQPGSGELWKLLALALWMQGKEALQALRHAAQLLPQDAESQANLGTALRARGQIEEAASCFRRAILLQPGFAEAHNNLGSALQDLGKLDEAMQCYGRASALDPQFAVAHCNLGNALRSMGRSDGALGAFRRALDLQPDLLEALIGLGNVLLELGQFDAAVAGHRRAAALRPDLARVHNGLGNALLAQGDLDAAEASCREALKLDPRFADAHTTLAMVLRLKDRPRDAEASCRRALELNPKLVSAIVFLAQLLLDSGEFAEAERTLRGALAIDPKSPEAWAMIPGLRRMTAEDEGWAEAALRLASQGLAPRREAGLRFAIGKYFDDLGEFARAFENYRRANDLCGRYGLPHDRAAVTREFDRVIEFYDRRWIMQARSANVSPRPVFIVGMPRSGTTLAEQILASHPDVYGAGEMTTWVGLSSQLLSSGLSPLDEGIMMAKLAADYLTRLQHHSAEATRVVNKMPENFRCLGLIHAALPNARIIHLRRHPIDTCLSIYFQDLHAAHSYANDLGDLAHYYRQYLRMMSHWRTVLPAAALLEVVYEDLVDEPEAWSRRMIEFLGLPWNPKCLDFHRTQRRVLTFSRWQARQKISKVSVARWRNYEPFIAPLLPLAELPS